MNTDLKEGEEVSQELSGRKLFKQREQPKKRISLRVLLALHLRDPSSQVLSKHIPDERGMCVSGI